MLAYFSRHPRLLGILTFVDSMKTISEMFELYRKCCSGNLRVYEATEEEMADNKLYAKLHTPAAFIQIEHSDSAVISPLEDLGTKIRRLHIDCS